MRYKWEPYLRYGDKRVLVKGETTYLQGEKGNGFYYLAEGEMIIRMISEEGKERIIDYVLEGFLLGETGISEQPYSTSATCTTNSILYYFSIDTFKLICNEHPEAMSIFMESLSYKIRLLAETVAMINKPYEKQMAHFLMQLSKKHDNLSVPITQTSLAHYIGTSRITVYKITRKWSDKGIISMNNHRIDILDLKEMKVLS